MKRPLVSIIIVNWNGLHFLKPCLKTLSNCTYKNKEIIVVDNGSCDGSVKWLQENYHRVRICSLSRNVGFAQGNNEGYCIAKGEFIVFLNNDTKVHPDFIDEMIAKWQSDKTIGGVQSKLLLMDAPSKLDSVGAFFTRSGFLYHWGFGKKDSPVYDKTTKLFTAKGACMGFPRHVLEKILVNGVIFDPSYFSYFEETDLCHRIWLTGKTIQYAPKSIVYHTMGGTSTSMNNAYIQFHSYKNRIHSYLKNFEWKNLWFLPLHIFTCIVIAFVLLLQGKPSYSRAILGAITWNAVHFSDTWKKRLFIQKHIRRIPDSSYMPFVLVSPKLDYYMYLFQGTVGYKEKEWIEYSQV